MIIEDIPGYKRLEIRNLILDYNGTLALDGQLLPGVQDALNKLAHDLQINIHIITADTFGRAEALLRNIRCTVSTILPENQHMSKLDYLRQLGCEDTVCIGNGRNDRLMLKEAILGIAVILEEGAAVETIQAADIVCTNILSALDLLNNPLRLHATLRS